MVPEFIVLLGAPGAGKGTQAEGLLSKTLDIPHVASGDLFREALAEGTELGLLAKSYIESGVLVPDDITIAMVQKRVAASDCKRGAILDGFPRTIEQAVALERVLSEDGKSVCVVLYIKVSTETLMARLGGRWICRNCGAVYHSLFDPPKEAGKCDKCGGELYQRSDDTPEVQQKRIDVYLAQTALLIEYYRSQGILAEIDGDKSVEEVQADMLKAIETSC
ncbi:MAG TPA: adenylate kinase [Methanophagales archaeon]|nr:adenylate kinase [Methanophagales archaeon]